MAAPLRNRGVAFFMRSEPQGGVEAARNMPEFLSISEHSEQIATGDVLLFRAGDGLVSRLISVGGRGPWSHAALAAWWGDDLFCLEVREWYGGRAVLLDREVAKRPQRIEVYRLRADLRTAEMALRSDTVAMHAVVRTMARFAGGNYGYRSVLRTALYHLPFIRFAMKPMTDDEMENGLPPYCSQAVAYSYRVSGDCDLVPNAADCVTEPSDLARSALLEYQFTLVP